MDVKDIELIRVLSGIEDPDLNKDYGTSKDFSAASAESVADALGQAVAESASPVDIEDAMRSFDPKTSREVGVRMRLKALEDHVAHLSAQVEHLRQCGVATASHRVKPSDLGDWDDVLYGDLDFQSRSPLRDLETGARPVGTRLPPPPPAKEPWEEDTTLILGLKDPWAVECVPIADRPPAEHGRFGDLDWDQDRESRSPKSETHARFADLFDG